MKKYVTHATVLGLGPGDTFSSDDEFYAEIAKSGIIEEVIEDGGSTSGGQLGSVAEGAEGHLGEGNVGSSAEGGGKGQGTLPK